MRWEDWDVLLFAAHAPHAPLQEFCVVPFSVHGHGLLTSYVPSQAPGSVFTVSVHSWNKPPDDLVVDVKLLVDGVCVAMRSCAGETTWPQAIATTTVVCPDGATQPLIFPRFHQSIVSQSTWNALEDLGRIKVELYINHLPHVIFSFQHAPLELLQRAGIAWPNHYQFRSTNTSSLAGNMLHQAAINFVSLPSSRSSSGYPDVPAYANMPLLPPPNTNLTTLNKQYQPVRISSDQFQAIINALGSPQQKQHAVPALEQAALTNMPPPPLPAHAMADKRGESRSSDVSMHPDCTAWPTCTSEDAEGRMTHASPTTLQAIVKGKKEGSSPSKPIAGHDFLATVLGEAAPNSGPQPSTLSSSSPAETQSKKRTRSALRSLNINDGSPEKRDQSKPVRKQTRRTSAVSDKENAMVDEVL